MTDRKRGPLKIAFDSLKWKDRGAGVYTTFLATTDVGAEQMSSGITRCVAGGSVPGHKHNCEEQVTVLEGNVRAEMGDQVVELSRHDSTFIPANTTHRFINIGESEAMWYFIYGRKDANRTFSNSGETIPVGSERDVVLVENEHSR